MATKLESLLIKEISGVDLPANGLDGWMVAKAKAAEDVISNDIGADVPREATATSIVEKIKQILHGKDDLEMTQEELEKALDTRDERLVETIKSLLPSAEAPIEGAAAAPEVPAVPVVTAPEPISVEDVAKAVKEAVDPLLEIIEPMLNRIEGLEKGTAVRKSLDGQESANDKGEPKEPTLGDAIKAAFRSPVTPVNA